MGLRIDLHVHTSLSPDSLIEPEDLIFYAKRRGLDGVAITDHDRISTLFKVVERAELLVIPGTEISSLNGHIVGLNITEMVPPRLSVKETVERIHKAGGLSVACHPITFFKESLKGRITSEFDAIEVINSLAFPFNYSVRRSRRIALDLDIPCVAGSDAHYGPEIGYAYTLVDSEPRIDDVLEAIRNGSCLPYGRAVPLRMRIEKELMLLRRKLGWRRDY